MNKMYNFLGIMKRANKLCVGTNLVLDKIRKKEVYLVLLADNILDNTKKTITDKSKFYEIKCLENLEYFKLNQAIGEGGIKVVGITDKNASEKILEMIKF